jgi:hypothetical protein
MDDVNSALCMMVIVFGVLAAAGAYLLWEFSTRAQHARVIATRWRREGRAVHYAPAWAQFYGVRPRGTYHQSQAQHGTLGVVEDHLVFVPRHGPDRIIPLGAIHWVGTRHITIRHGKHSSRKNALVVHYDLGGAWRVGVWVSDRRTLDFLPVALGKLTGHAPLRLGARREDHGPARTQRLEQDIYGQWHPTDGADVHGELYLAPDRLLYNMRDPIHLAQIRQIDLYGKGGLSQFNPFNEELLRIEYETADGERRVLGFLVIWGQRWADELDRRTGVPVEVHAGRKKKTDG